MVFEIVVFQIPLCTVGQMGQDPEIIFIEIPVFNFSLVLGRKIA